MYQFSEWCFLCASEKDVTVQIKSLEEPLRENIGQFSIINFTLVGVPSNICRSCFEFLSDYERRKSKYAKAEQMFVELLKTRNKPVDVAAVRLKHGLDCQSEPPELATPESAAPKPQEYFQVIEHVIDEIFPEVKTTSANFIIEEIDELPNDICSPATSEVREDLAQSPACKTNRNSTAKQTNPTTGKVKETPNEATRSSRRLIKSPTMTPKLLNPTIRPRISNIVRLDLFNCDLCPHSCSTRLAIERHMKQIHLKASSTSFKCGTCSKSFAKKVILQNHQKIHLIHRPTFDCQICGKVLSSQTAVSNHMQWMHKERREYKCSSCCKLFATKGSLTEHEKTHSDIKGHICPICNKSYKTASTLSQHVDTHGKTEYHCVDCGARLNSKRTLRQHMVKHSDVVRHTCDFCSAEFKRTKAYKEHLISVHTNIRAYSCEWCSKTFANGANCRKHKKENHPNELALADKSKEKNVVKLPKIEEILIISNHGKLAAT